MYSPLLHWLCSNNTYSTRDYMCKMCNRQNGLKVPCWHKLIFFIFSRNVKGSCCTCFAAPSVQTSENPPRWVQGDQRHNELLDGQSNGADYAMFSHKGSEAENGPVLAHKYTSVEFISLPQIIFWVLRYWFDCVFSRTSKCASDPLK